MGHRHRSDGGGRDRINSPPPAKADVGVNDGVSDPSKSNLLLTLSRLGGGRVGLFVPPYLYVFVGCGDDVEVNCPIGC